MNHEDVQPLVATLADHPGIHGCALADSTSGMVLFHAGRLPDMESTAEAAIEFWRVHSRHPAQFARFGPLQSAAFSFTDKVVTLFPCTTQGLVLVCVAEKSGMDWPRWGEAVRQLKARLS